MSRRTEKIASTIRQELAMILLRDIDDPRIKMLPGITRVEVSEDLSVANVFVSIMGTPGAQTAALNALKHSAGMMRTKLAKMLTIRQMPFINFQIDEGMKKEIEMLELLHKLEVERKEREALQDGKGLAGEVAKTDGDNLQGETQNEK